MNYDYSRLNVETRSLADDTAINTNLRPFWDGGLLANTPLRQTYIAHIDYWRRVRKSDDVPNLRFSIINLHPVKQDYLPTDYDGVVDRKNDIIHQQYWLL